MKFFKCLIQIHSLFLRLYPPSFRNQFGDEIHKVFCDLLDEAGSHNFWQIFLCFGRECRALPGNVIRAHIDAVGELPMLSNRRIIQINTIGFGIAFILMALLNFVTRYYLFPLQGDMHPIIVYIFWLLFAGILMGFLGGGAIAISIAPQRKLPFILASGFGYVLSLFLTGPSIWAVLGLPTDWVTSSLESFFVLGSEFVNGLLVGLMIGWVWKGWKTGLIFGLMSGIIFELGFWVNWLVLFVMNANLQHNLTGSTAAELGWILLTWAIAYLLFGAVVGVLWGILVGRVRRMSISL